MSVNREGGLKQSSACVTNAGAVRELNEDACLTLPDSGLWVVADGVGGHHEGEIASRLIVDKLSRINTHDRLSQLVNEVEDRVQEVHQDLVRRAAAGGKDMIIGSTFAALLAVTRFAVCLWAGDSRVYRLRDGLLDQITRDHSHVEELIEQGTLQRELAEDHPWANVITRAVGAGEKLFLDAEFLELRRGDRYLICSDGLYKEVSESDMADHLQYGDSMSICKTLVALALDKGASDNVTVVVIKFD